MKLTKVSLVNFKAFKQAEPILSNLTVFSGLNGMGKSTIIQSLLLLRQSFELGKLNVRGGLFLDGEYSKPGKGKDVYAFTGEGDKIEINLTLEDTQEIKFAFQYVHNSDLQPTISIEKQIDLDTLPLFNNNFQYLNAERLSPERDTFPASQSNVEKGNLGKHGQYTVHYISENQRNALNIPALKHPNAKAENLIENINAWLGEVAPGVAVNVVYYPELNVSKLSYKYEASDGVVEEYRANNTGFGLTYVLPVLTAILSAKPGDLLVIENPESHLHPAGQASIGRLCALAAQNSIQIIIETHSDHVINGILISLKKNSLNPAEGLSAENLKMYFVKRNQDAHESESYAVEIAVNGKVQNAPPDFFDQYSKDMMEMMGF